VDPRSVNPFLSDSALKAGSHHFNGDTAASTYLMPDSSRMGFNFINSLKKISTGADFLGTFPTTKKDAKGAAGNLVQLRDKWVIMVIIGLLTFAGLLNLFFGPDIKSVVQSFYNKRSISQSDREAGLINSWAFIGLILLFCL